MTDLSIQGQFAPPLMQMQGVESAASASAAQAKALVEARYAVAFYRPRNWDDVRVKIKNECKRPAFAHNKSAYYRKPIGQGVEGLGIRFVEVAFRCMTNVLTDVSMLFEDSMKEIHQVTVTDLESNVPYSLQVRVEKTVERSKPASDGSYISKRQNSYGKDVFVVPAQEDDLLNKRAALISKAIRTLGMRIIPGDLQDEAEEIIKAVRLDAAAKDPGAERKRIADAFAELHIMPSQLAEYLDHGLEQCSPAELVELRGLYGAIRDGEATWVTAMENKAERTPMKTTGRPESASTTAYPADQFAKDLAGWGKAIAKGKKPEDIIKTAQTKYALSDAQKAAITALAKPADAPTALTYAQAADLLNKAESVDALNDAATHIPRVADEQQRVELNALYDTRLAALQE